MSQGDDIINATRGQSNEIVTPNQTPLRSKIMNQRGTGQIISEREPSDQCNPTKTEEQALENYRHQLN